MNDIRDEIIDERKTLEEHQDQRERIECRLDQIDDERAERETTIEKIQDERETFTDAIESLKTEVEQQESEDYTELLDLHTGASQLEFELDRLESDRNDVAEEIVDRIATLIEHVEAYADDLLVVLLPEDPAALHEDYQRVTDI